MPKCELKIEFYRPDRSYRTGDKVQGWVRVNVDRDVRCRGLSLLARWGTHGRGNPSQENYHQETLFQGQWRAAEQYEYPFEFEPPPQPLTYRGHYLNIDHYVSVRADIPWSIDPRCEEEFLWLPGPVVGEYEPVNTAFEYYVHGFLQWFVLGTSIVTLIAVVQLLRWGLWIGVLLLFAPLLLALMVFRQQIAERRLGTVDWEMPDRVSPDQPLATKVSIGPGQHSGIRDVTLQLTGQESVTSGSGSNRSTSAHELFNQQYPLISRPNHLASEVLELNHEFEFPPINAWSVDLPDNQITWTMNLRIRLGWWPDWSRARKIHVMPTPAIEADSNPAFQPEPVGKLLELIEQLENAGSDQPAVDQLIAAGGEQLFALFVIVDEIVPTDNKFGDPEYASGRTIHGTITGSEFSVLIQTTRQHNERMDSLMRGQSWNGSGVVVGWNSQTRRTEILAF